MITKRLRRLLNDFKKLSWLTKVVMLALFLLVLVMVFILGTRAGNKNTTDNTVVSDNLRQVVLVSVGETSQTSDPIRVTGKVSARQEANVRTEAQGRVTSVLVSEGSSVFAGQTLATIENSLQLAAIEQAEASLSLAKANISRGGNNAGLNLETIQRSFVEAKNNAYNSVLNSFNQVKDALFLQADALFFNSLTNAPELRFIVPFNQKLKTQSEDLRVQAGRVFAEWQSFNSSLSSSSISVEDVSQVEEYVIFMRDFFASLQLATSGLQVSEGLSFAEISNWQASASGARSVASGVLTSLSALKSSLIQAENNLALAESELDQSKAEVSNTTANASLRQAEAVLESAKSNLEKTIIRSPISGTITSLDIKTGDFVSVLQPVALISNSNSLEIVSYISEQDRDSVEVGSDVSVSGLAGGARVVSVAPNIDSNTQKYEVKVAPSPEMNLVDGQNLTIFIERKNEDTKDFYVPLSALKVLTTGTVILTVDDSGVVYDIPIEVGPIVGDKIFVYSGVDAGTLFVEDVRGVSVGDKVVIVSDQS